MLERGKESLAIKVHMPRHRCAHCTRSLASGDRLELTVYHDGSLITVTICRACLMEHVPEAYAELTAEQPRRFQ